MKKSTKKFKRLFTLLLIVLMSIENIGAVVSDNDGSAFITKAEFDSLKNNFQSQIDQYNTSIDSKIDGAIASYLQGIKLGKKNPLTLDRNCMYTFPMTCYIDDNRLWNDEHSPYYCLSLPALTHTNYITYANRINSDRSIVNDAQVALEPPDGQPFRVTTTNASPGIRLQDGKDVIQYDGRDGNLYQIKKSALTRNIDGTNRTVWQLQSLAFGKDTCLNFGRQLSSTWDGNPTSYKAYMDYEYIGYGVRCWTYPGEGWVGATTEAQSFDTWNYNVGLQAWHQRVYVPGMKAEADHYDGSINNYDQTKLWYNSEVATKDWINGNGVNLSGKPIVRILDNKNPGKNKMIFAGTAYLPSYNEGGYSYTPRPLTADPEDTKVTATTWNFSAREKMYVWAMNGVPFTTGTFNLKRHYVWPEWHATPYTNWQQETSNDFSMIRASVVSYEDSNGKTHYLDEGLYLGKYEDEGKVEFKIKFNGNNGISTRFALSKKPFGFNRNDNDRIKFKFTIDAEPTTPAIEVPAGGYGAINTNYTIIIKVDDIEKNDELYMIWWPANSGDYVELDNITEYYLETL